MNATGDRGQGIGSGGGVRRRSLFAIRRRAAGFTIIELMIAAVIALVIFGIGLMMVTGASNAHAEAKARIRTNDKARMFFEQFERDLAGAYTGHYRRDALVQTLATVAGTYAAMTTTTEDFEAGTGTEYQSVRYYVVAATKRLCRERTRNAALPVAFDGTPDVTLCADIESMETSYWVSTGGTFAAGTSANATHLLVKLTMLDPNDRQKDQIGNPVPLRRFFQVYIPIPDGLLE